MRSTREGATLPAAALAHLYRNLRGACGEAAVDHVIAALTVYPPGSFVALADGNVARVVRVSEEARLSPLVCLFDESMPASQSEIVDLAEPAGRPWSACSHRRPCRPACSTTSAATGPASRSRHRSRP